MDGAITQMQDHETVQIWDFFDPTIPAAWDDKNQDGQWDHVEEITVMDSDFERKMQNTKVNLQFFYELSPKFSEKWVHSPKNFRARFACAGSESSYMNFQKIFALKRKKFEWWWIGKFL